MGIGGAGVAVAAIVIAAKRKHIYSIFRRGLATTASDARTLQDLGVADSRILRMLVRRGDIVKVDADHYFLDETAVSAGRKLRLMLVVGAVLIVVMIVLIMKFLAP